MKQLVLSRFVVWLLLVSVLILSVIYAGQKLQLRTIDTAYAVAAKRMLDKANYYKENWVIRKEPESMVIEGKNVQFSPEGWPLPIKEDQLDCRYWLLLLNESEEVFGYSIDNIKSHHLDNGYICSYSYIEQDAIILKLINKKLSVSINLSSRQIN